MKYIGNNRKCSLVTEDAHGLCACRTVLRVQVTVQPTFQWRDASHGNSMQWHIWVEDSENEHVYHSETWTLTKKMMREPEHRLAFTIPIFEPLPPQYYIRWDASLIAGLPWCFHCHAA